MAKARSPRRAARKAPAKKRGAARSASKKKTAKIPTAAEYLVQLKKLRKEEDRADFAMMSDDTILLPVSEYIPTGNLEIDRLIGGGWAVGRITEVCAWENVGKSTLLDQSIAQVQRMHGIGCLIDSEKARVRKYTEALGVNTSDLILHEADTIEQVFEGVENFLTVQEIHARGKRIPPPLLVIWDSLGGTPTNAELKGDADDEHVASAAKVIRKNLRRLAQRIAKLRVAIVISNHFYKQIGGGGFGPAANIPYGGKGLGYFCSLRLWLARTGWLKSGGQIIGQEVEAKIKKTRIGMPKPPVKTGLIFGAGFDNSYSLHAWGKKAMNPNGHPWVQVDGSHSWLHPPGEEGIYYQRGFLGLGHLLTENPKVYRAMAKQFLRDED